ncbi:hypothetical protein LRS10_01145 [Phenylobacterium sp. J426]|uniref:hypothetical protein n=1 Tax=Phenylobacterium sp. J426 TaxID=2898439 RepID=UPI0021512ED8|nr:hypothetical protein [Phenylobacterium sp. J426]MCR5872924.1 hypothetical protein [Phenylobacterium sp. J426]
MTRRDAAFPIITLPIIVPAFVKVSGSLALFTCSAISASITPALMKALLARGEPQ